MNRSIQIEGPDSSSERSKSLNFVTPPNAGADMLKMDSLVGSAPNVPRLPLNPDETQLHQISEERKSFAEPETDLGKADMMREI